MDDSEGPEASSRPPDHPDAVPELVHLTVPRSRRYQTSAPGVAIHTTLRPLTSDDIVTREGMRITSPSRSIVDAADAGTGPDQVARAVRQAVERGLTTPTQLRAAARGRGSRVGGLIDRALEEVSSR